MDVGDLLFEGVSLSGSIPYVCPVQLIVGIPDAPDNDFNQVVCCVGDLLGLVAILLEIIKYATSGSSDFTEIVSSSAGAEGQDSVKLLILATHQSSPATWIVVAHLFELLLVCLMDGAKDG